MVIRMKKDELRDKDFDPFIDKSKKKTKDISLDDEEIDEKPKRSKRTVKKVKRNVFTKFDSVDILLLVILIALLILTIFLGFNVHNAKKNYK